jgi:hypothetical protein
MTTTIFKSLLPQLGRGDATDWAEPGLVSPSHPPRTHRDRRLVVAGGVASPSTVLTRFLPLRRIRYAKADTTRAGGGADASPGSD